MIFGRLSGIVGTRRWLSVLSVPLFVLVIASCQMAVLVEREEALQASPEQLAEGKQLYEQHCATCHELYGPDELGFNGWHVAMRAYGPRTKLDYPGRHSVLRYLIWASQQEKASGAATGSGAPW